MPRGIFNPVQTDNNVGLVMVDGAIRGFQEFFFGDPILQHGTGAVASGVADFPTQDVLNLGQLSSLDRGQMLERGERSLHGLFVVEMQFVPDDQTGGVSLRGPRIGQ